MCNKQDYTNPEHRSYCLPMVDKAHFTPDVVQNLFRGHSTARLEGDLDYTLRAFPNHHRALLAMARFQLLHQNNFPNNLTPAECYLQRAAVFSPNDPNIPFLYGFYLHREGLYNKALSQYKKSERMAPDNPTLHYYMAKLYLETDEKGKATQHAERASSLGISSGNFK